MPASTVSAEVEVQHVLDPVTVTVNSKEGPVPELVDVTTTSSTPVSTATASEVTQEEIAATTAEEKTIANAVTVEETIVTEPAVDSLIVIKARDDLFEPEEPTQLLGKASYWFSIQHQSIFKFVSHFFQYQSDFKLASVVVETEAIAVKDAAGEISQVKFSFLPHQ